MRARPAHPQLLLWGALGLVALLVVTTGIVMLAPTQPARISASSTALGFSAESLASSRADGPGWRSEDTDPSPTVVYRLGRSRELDRIDVTAPSGGSLMRSGHVEFGDGSAVHFAADPRARSFSIRFVARPIDRFTLVGDVLDRGATHVQLSRIAATLDGSAVRRGDAPDAVAATSSLASPPRLSASGDLGGWAPGSSDAQPTVRLSWRVPQEVDVVTAIARPGAPAFRGEVRFSDGTSVPLGVVGPSKPSTTAFMARVTTSVTISATEGRLSLERVSTSAGGAAPTAKASSAQAPSPLPCTDAAGSTAGGGVRILCPTPGTTVGAGFTVRARTTPDTTVTASAWVPGLQVVQAVASAAAGADGLVDLRVDASSLLHGPLNVLVSAGSGGQAVVQVVNSGGVPDDARDTAPPGLRQVYEDRFDGPVSVSLTGDGTRYSALKPSADGATQFGDAPFSDPAAHPDQIAAVPDGYLRLQLSQVQSGSERRLEGAIVSSYSAAGSGFSALDGYFEARILGGPGTGAWPAFWMLSADSAYQRSVPVSEVDAVELYGRDRRTGCYSTHNYSAGRPDLKHVDCTGLAAPADDWALQWHTYAVRITPHEAVFSVDGAPVARGPRTVAGDQPMFFMLDLAAGGGWPVDLSPTSGVSQMYVDWVRVKV